MGPVPGVFGTLTGPAARLIAVGQSGIEIVPLHRAMGMCAAQEVPLTCHRFDDRLIAQIIFVHFDAAQHAVGV